LNTNTTNDLAPNPKSDRRWLLYFFGLLIVCLILMLAGVNYRSHLYYQYLITFHDFGNVSAVEVQPLPHLEPPADWVKVTEGRLEFWLPSDFASGRHVDDGGIGSVIYSSGTRTFALLNPEERWVSDTPKSSDFGLGPITLRQIAKVYQTDANDFRWSMTSEEAASQSRRVVLASMTNSMIKPPVEARFEEEIDGLLVLHIDQPEMAFFQWESKTCPWEGQFMFRDKTGTIDLQWVRIVCASLRFNCEPDEKD